MRDDKLELFYFVVVINSLTVNPNWFAGSAWERGLDRSVLVVV